ncbi:hypothetical protein AB0F36_08015 [Streptomyces sp. NPDC029080]|uniref:hypothetical protein n=1 Tax=Streptomyces sp. NPDC029080 TaxID=3155017 RepID=UPI0033E064C8
MRAELNTRRAACGCTVKRGQHTYEQRVWTVDVYDREGNPLETLDVIARTGRDAKSRLLVGLYRKGINAPGQGWVLVPAGFEVRERECCRDARWCWACETRADERIPMP